MESRSREFIRRTYTKYWFSARDRSADVRMMNRAHSPKMQYCSEGRRQKSMHFPATNKFLMTVPRRSTTHSEIEYLRLVAFPRRLRIASANGNIGIAYPFSSANLVWKVSLMKLYIYLYLRRSHTKIDLFTLVGKIKELAKYRDRNKFERTIFIVIL